MKRTITFIPADLEDSALTANTTRGLSSVNAVPCIEFANQATAMIRVDTPMLGWIGGDLKITTIYASDGISGDFLLRLTGAAYNLDDAVSIPFNTPNTAVTTASGVMKKHETIVTAYAATGISVPEYLTVTVRRSGTNILDTSNDTMEWISVEIEYDVA